MRYVGNRHGGGTARIDEHVTFVLASGKRHFGKPGDRATVSMYVSDEDHLGYVGQTLAACFGELWGVEPELTVGAYEPNARRHRQVGDVTFVVWPEGDMSVGIPRDEARVTMWVADAEYADHAAEMLQAAFSEFWDMRRVHVVINPALKGGAL